MEKLNLKHISNKNLLHSSLIEESVPFSNSFLDDWVRFIKYALIHEQFDKHMNLYIRYEELKHTALIYSSDRLNNFYKTLDYLIERNYLINYNKLYYFNSFYFTNSMLERSSINPNVSPLSCIAPTWHIDEDESKYILLGHSDVLATNTTIATLPKTHSPIDSFKLQSLQDVLICPIYLEFLYDCFSYFKKHNDFIYCKKIKDLFYRLSDIHPADILINNQQELLNLINPTNNTPLLVECLNTNNSGRTFVLIINNIITSVFLATGPTMYEIIMSAVAMKELNNIKKLLIEIHPLIKNDDSLSLNLSNILNLKIHLY